MKIGGAAARSQGSNADPRAFPGGNPAFLALLEHVALELAQEYIELMDAAASRTPESDDPTEGGDT